MLKSDQCIVVYCAGDPRVNGCFIETPFISNGRPMYRKLDSNVGIVQFGGKWYISDCGDEFTPAGESHLDFYSSADSDNLLPIDVSWSVEEDGFAPAPRTKVCDPRGVVTLGSALRVAAGRYMSSGDLENAVTHLESIIAVGVPKFLDFVHLSEVYLNSMKPKQAWDVLISLSTKDDLLLNENLTPKYSIDDRTRICRLLQQAFDDQFPTTTSINDLTKSLSDNPTILRFLEFTVYICEKLKASIEFIEDATTPDVEMTETQRQFKLAGGLELAISLREIYRQIDLYTFESRDTAILRMKIFSLTDLFRRFTSDCRCDAKGRDPSFKTFWEAGMTKNDPPSTVYDPRELEARSKDNDPAKEVKCSVIKSINDSSDSDSSQFEIIRSRLRDTKISDTVYSITDLHNHDCNNPDLKLISIHGIVFDVTQNLEKYAPDGEYYFFAGHDITYPLAVSALSGDHVDKLYKMTSNDHLKRIYGWMEYFEKKYKVVGLLGEWDGEDQMEDPPAGEDEPEMQCRIM
jgi:hypothetical protein